MNLNDFEETETVLKALRRFRKEQVSKRVKLNSGEWEPAPGQRDTIERQINLIDRLLSRCVEQGPGEAVVTSTRGPHWRREY